jgi:hypothetical protein
MPILKKYWHNFSPCIAFEFLDVSEQETYVPTPYPLFFLSCIACPDGQSIARPVVKVPI